MIYGQAWSRLTGKVTNINIFLFIKLGHFLSDRIQPVTGKDRLALEPLKIRELILPIQNVHFEIF